MSQCEKPPISTLSYRECGKGSEVQNDTVFGCNKIILALVLYVVIVAIVYFVLIASKPTFVLQKDARGNVTAEVDFGKVLLFSILISLIIVIILYGLWYAFGNQSSDMN